MEKLSLKILAEKLDAISSRLEALESRAPSPSVTPACYVCSKPGPLQSAPIPLGDKLSPRVTRAVCSECARA